MADRFQDAHYIGNGCSCDLDIELDETIINLAGGSDKHFAFTQNAPSDVWVINHGLNKFPSVSVVDSAGTECQGEVKYIDTNNVEVHFGAAFSGKAYLN